MSPRADHAATIIAAADDRRVPSQDHHPAADRNGQAGNNPAHPAKRTLILNREPQPATAAIVGVYTSGAYRIFTPATTAGRL